jgi:hypothetical protein
MDPLEPFIPDEELNLLKKPEIIVLNKEPVNKELIKADETK